MNKIGRIILAMGLMLAMGAAPAAAGGMFDVYADNRAQGIGNDISTDFVLLAAVMLQEEIIATAEDKQLMPLLEQLLARLQPAAANFKPHGVFSKAVIQANRDYLAVLHGLLNGRRASSQSPRVRAELQQIDAAAGIATSALMGQQVDYSQFTVRGRYTRSADAGHYFQALKYAGTPFFAVLDTPATGIGAATADRLTGQALLLARWITGDAATQQLYDRLEAWLAALFGPGRTLTPADYAALDAAAGQVPMANLRQALLQRARDHQRQPLVIDALVDPGRLAPGFTAADAVTGLRLIPGRFTPDAAAMQSLVYDQVTDFEGSGTPFTLTRVNGRAVKGFALGQELLALLGSQAADARLAVTAETDYAGYAAAARIARARLGMPGGLFADYLPLMQAWLNGAPDSADRLTTCLGLYTLQRHATLLYAKQSYTAMLKGFGPSGQRAAARLAPASGVYARLRIMFDRLHALSADDRAADFADLMARCGRISYRADLGLEPLPADIAFLNDLDLTLERLIGRKDAPIVADVHTDANSDRVLYMALGPPRVVESKTAQGQVLRGACFAPLTFKYPLQQRLTDAAWAAMTADPAAMQHVLAEAFSMPAVAEAADRKAGNPRQEKVK
jgi:hypothetical protein